MSHLLRIAGFLILTMSLTALICIDAKAQHLQGGRKKTDSVPLFRRAPLSDTAIEARLVTLALQGPRFQSTDHQINVAESQLKRAKRSWLNLLAISANYNDQTFAKTPAAAGSYVYPKYFFGLTIPIGLFFSMGPEIKGAREGVEIVRNTQEELARTLRFDVLSKYKQYKNFGDLILLQNTIVVDMQTAFTQVEKKFQDGIVTIDLYNQANRSYSDELAKKLNLQLAQDMVKLEIEKIIGTSLESVIR